MSEASLKTVVFKWLAKSATRSDEVFLQEKMQLKKPEHSADIALARRRNSKSISITRRLWDLPESGAIKHSSTDKIPQQHAPTNAHHVHSLKRAPFGYTSAGRAPRALVQQVLDGDGY
jgi:hypothetical protein